jgi:CHAT domain-containing protein/tetratricopeptide (TPR) repeat protein
MILARIDRQALAHLFERCHPQVDGAARQGSLGGGRVLFYNVFVFFILYLAGQTTAFPQTSAGPQTAADRAAAQLSSHGREAYAASNYAEAEEYYLKALAIQQMLAPGSIEVADSLISLASLSRVLTDFAKAEDYYSRASAIVETLSSNSLRVADIFDALAGVAKMRYDFWGAQRYYNRALLIYQELTPNGIGVARELDNLGLVARGGGDFEGEEDFVRRALAIWQKISDDQTVAELRSLGGIAWRRLDFATADKYYNDALTLATKKGANSLATGILYQLAHVARASGNLAKMTEYNRDLRAAAENTILLERGSNTETAAVHLSYLGTLLTSDFHDPGNAEIYYREALAIWQRIDPANIRAAHIRYELGHLLAARGELSQAEDDYNQALVVYQKEWPILVPLILIDLGRLALHRGNITKAQEYERQALERARKQSPDDSSTAQRLWDFGAEVGRIDLSPEETYYRESLEVQKKLRPADVYLAQNLHSFGSFLLRKGEFTEAAKYFSQSIDALERQMIHFGGPESFRSAFRAEYSEYYRDYIYMLLDGPLAGQQEAFEVLERSRARSLLEMLAERDLVFSADLPSDVQRARKTNAADYDRTQAKLSALHPANYQEQSEPLVARLEELAAERERIIGQIRRDSPRFAALQYPQPLDLAATRRTLDPGTVLLSYSVGKEETLLFVVQPEDSKSDLSVFRLPLTETALRQKVEAFRKLIDQHNANDQKLGAQARELYDVLIRPAESSLESSQRLLIVADGPLHILPFPALMRDEKQYLVEWKPIHSAISATVYAELKKNRRDTTISGPAELVAFGDPQYPAAEESKPEKTMNTEVRSAVERGLSFARLAFSRQEVENIAALYPGHNHKYLGGDATEERAKSLGKQVRYIHFATHGVLDERFPLNSALVLTIPGKVAEGQDNGLLQAWEIFDQVRIDADLVTLSACGTALGKEMGGEGLIGLTRAFQYAGARSVLASLWNLDDFRAAEFMKQFYGQLKLDKTKDEALRNAQLQMIHSKTASHPFYWAAFTLNGDWR